MTVLTDTQVVTASGGLVELGYVEIASSVTVTSSTAGSGTEIIAPLTVVCDGSPVLVEFFCGQISTPNTSGAQTYTTLNQDGVEKVRYWGFASSPAATYDDKPQHLSYRTTPSAGSHTFGVKAFNSAPSLSAFYKAQNTTIGVSPAFLRVSKIVQATQWPAVTTGSIICTSSTRPASPFAGQQIYETDTSKSLIYNGTAWVQTENLGAWTTYTPTLTNIAVGTGGQAKNEGRYIRLGSLVMFEIQIALGTSGGSVSGVIGATLPPITQQAAGHHSFSARMRDAGTAIFDTLTDNSTIGRVEVYALSASGTYASGATTSSTVPFTWAANDEVFIWGFYEAAA